MILLALISVAALIWVCPAKDKHRDSYTVVCEDDGEVTEEETRADEDKQEEDDAEAPAEAKDQDGENENQDQGGGSSPSGGSGQGEGGGTSGGSGQGGSHPGGSGNNEPPVPKYDYFMEGGFYICKGCYLPFPDIYALNAHECSFHETEECAHKWEIEYNDVWVEATGHYEYGIVQDGYDEAVYEERCVCKKCGEYFLTSEEAADHIISAHGNEGSWTVMSVVVSYIHHDPVYGQIFVIDEEAHWVKVIYRYRCKKCGEIQYP